MSTDESQYPDGMGTEHNQAGQQQPTQPQSVIPSATPDAPTTNVNDAATNTPAPVASPDPAVSQSSGVWAAPTAASPPATPQPTTPQQPATPQPWGYGQPAQHQPAQHQPVPLPPSSPRFAMAPGNGHPTTGYPTGPYAAAAERHKPRRPRTLLTVTTAAVLAAALASGGTAWVMDQRTPTTAAAPVTQVQGIAANSDGSPDWEAVAAAVSPSVVAINVQLSQGSAAGSGVILDTAGHILTNNHVIAGARQVQVLLSDGRLYAADVVGADETTDLAVIKVQSPPSDLTPATFGTSADVAVGESVMAVGNPLGLDNTVTTGIVSALDRPVTASSQTSSAASVTNAIQIDAAVNPGNSGGPLFDSQGLVIGITSSIATLSSGGGESGSIGLGFAIPSDLASMIANQLITNGVATHAFLGVTLDNATATADGVTRQGAEVVQTTSGTPADQAGLVAGDVIVAIDSHAVNGAESLTGFVRQYASGDQVNLTVIRDGQSLQVPVTLTSREG